MEKEIKDKRLSRAQIDRKRIHEEKIARVPIENMMFKDLPPAFISVVGPPRSGKSTLIKSMVKCFTHQLIDTTNGPITLSSSKTKRITLFEVKADIHQFIDVSKISDLVIFTIDAATGLEMETFEFLSVLMSHGLSKVLCVVTNIDRKGNPKYLKSIKKRIWDEICPGIKFFYLGKMHNGRYGDADLSNLCRVLGVMKYRPIEWKCTHPHVVVDKIDESFVYGYVRGGAIKRDTDIHIPGFGDTKMVNVEVIADPVPLCGETKLSLKSKLLYSPMLGISNGEKEEVQKENIKIEITDEKEIKLFRKSKNIIREVEASKTEETIEKEVVTEDVNEDVTHGDTDESSFDFEELRGIVSDRFQKAAVTEEELIEKFNEKYEEKEKDGENFLLKEKKRLEELMKKNEQVMISGVVMPGQYVRIKLSEHLPIDVDFTNLIILGAFLVSEKGMTIVQGKIKKHKWCKRLLKTNEPLIFSVGWRRFQSIPIFSVKDATRNRVIKYSPDSMHCNVSFYGPIVPAGTGFSAYTENADFKILASGTVTDMSGNSKLLKKLKLVGYPKEILHNTVFVKDMFTSDLEVLKFQGASLKAVSGLRGQIKGPKGTSGEYRSTFEGKMLLSDIITLRCFVPVDVSKIFIPVNNLLGRWRGLRRLHEIREEMGIRHTYQESSSEDQSEYVPSEEFYGLPPEIERELPLDKRTISTVNSRIELPIAPDARESYEKREDIIKRRKKRDEEEDARRKEFVRKRENEKKIQEKEREEKLRKTIHENYKEKQKKFKKKR